jgi:hypothetical protein
MIIVKGKFNNTIKLAICIFPSDMLKHDQLKDIMIDYTTFYAHRLEQVSYNLDIVYADSIDNGLEQYSDTYNHILFMAAGVRIYDASVILDIAEEIEKTPNYIAAAHILEWKDNWYELHHQFVLVNCRNWQKIDRPEYGSRTPGKHNLVVIERSVENFHDDYTPLWIKDTGVRKDQFHCRQGWNLIDKGIKAGLKIINWNQNIRNKRTYYYPETNSDIFYQSYKLRKILPEITNFNQLRLLNEMIAGVSDQIWAINSEHMHVHNKNQQYEAIVLPASGFKYLDIFQSNALSNQGEIIIYDYNQLSIDWIKHIHQSRSYDIQELVKTFKHNNNLKWFGYDNPPIITNGKLAKGFLDGFKITKDYYRGNFERYLDQFRAKPVKFVKTDLIQNYFNLLNEISDKKCLLHISNIFSTDFLISLYGLSETQKKYDKFVSFLHPNTKIVGHTPKGKFLT